MELIEYYEQQHYGRTDRYVADPELARTIKMITGKNTLDDLAMKALEKLGHRFVQVLPPKNNK